MAEDSNFRNLLALLEGYKLEDAGDIALQVAQDFRRRRVEKNITRRHIAELSGVPLSTVARFEQKGLIAFEALVRLAMALGYTPEVRDIFGQPKFQTIEELSLIRSKTGDKRAYKRLTKNRQK